MNKDSFVALPTREQDVDIKLVQLRILTTQLLKGNFYTRKFDLAGLPVNGQF
jgi:hypothetical protein